jgi:VWFA-related protein
MSVHWALLHVSLAIASLPACLFYPVQVWAQNSPPESSSQTAGKDKPSDIPVFRSTTTLVYLDVTVVDKKGNPVVTGLTRDNFTVTEDKQPQRIFSFESPVVHGDPSAARVQSPNVILVLDDLNSSFDDFAYIRDQARAYLTAQPEELHASTALMVSGNQSLDMLQGYTRSRSDLLFALDHLPKSTSWKAYIGPDDRLRQTYLALMQIAIQNRGVPGRKLVIWLGQGGAGLNTADLPPKTGDMIERYIHRTINMMVEDRISLYWNRPGLVTNLTHLSKRELDGTKRETQSDAFTGNTIRFADFVDGTGGKTFNLNNLSTEMGESVALGSGYYTLTYQPHDDKLDGALRKIHVSVKNPDLQAITKVGYFAPESKEYAESDDSIAENLTEAAMATMPFKALDLTVARVVRHPDARSVEITLQVADPKISWRDTDSGQSSTTVIVTGISRSVSHFGRRDVLASRVAKYYLLAGSQDPAKLAGARPELKLTLPYPKQTKEVRVALASDDGARIGAVEIDKKMIDAAPEARSPRPELSRRSAAAGQLKGPGR